MANIIDEVGGLIRGGQQTIRLGVTGLSRAGKTVFITSLVANLLERERLTMLRAEADGTILAARVDEQPDATLPRFEYEAHLAKLLSPDPEWPEGTRNISEMRLSFRLRRSGVTSLLSETKTLHLDIIDYPGEWLLDLGLLDKNYGEWSAMILDRFRTDQAMGGANLVKALEAIGADETKTEVEMAALASQFTEICCARHEQGVHDLVPGRFILPGELAGAPVVTFAPLPSSNGSNRRSVYKVFEKRFDAYKREVIKPFFRQHFAKLDRQLVLVDVLRALEAGPEALGALEAAMNDILVAFKTGRNGWLSLIFGGKIDRIGFVATKADLLHHRHHEALVDLMRALLKRSERNIAYQGALLSAKAVAAVRATVEDTKAHGGQDLSIVRGRRIDNGAVVSFHFGELPRDPQSYLAAPDGRKFAAPKLAPPILTERVQAGLPHIRMDQFIEFIIGQELRG